MAPKRKSGDAGDSDMPKRIHKVLPLSEKVKVLDMRHFIISHLKKVSEYIVQ